MLTKESAKRLQRDYIPNGKSVDISTLRFRRTDDHEVYQCCQRTGHDIQSGAIYCGKISEYVASVEGDGIVALCESHKPPTHLLEE